MKETGSRLSEALSDTHTALLIGQGEHPTVIQQRLGHASIRTTLDTYGHLLEGLDQTAADRLEEAFQAADVVEMWSVGQGAVVDLPQK
jgi:integrase